MQTVLQPRLDALQYELPPGCPLDVSKDMFKVQEAHKVLVRSNKWRCTWDDKVPSSAPRGSNRYTACHAVWVAAFCVL